MSAVAPVTVGEQKARDWAVSLDATPGELVTQIAALREEHRAAAARAREVHAEWLAASDASDQLRDRIEALKYRLVSEL